LALSQHHHHTALSQRYLTTITRQRYEPVLQPVVVIIIITFIIIIIIITIIIIIKHWLGLWQKHRLTEPFSLTKSDHDINGQPMPSEKTTIESDSVLNAPTTEAENMIKIKINGFKNAK